MCGKEGAEAGQCVLCAVCSMCKGGYSPGVSAGCRSGYASVQKISGKARARQVSRVAVIRCRPNQSRGTVTRANYVATVVHSARRLAFDGTV